MNLIRLACPNKTFAEIINDIVFLDHNQGPWLCGGAVRKVFFGQDWTKGDCDIFFSSKRQLDFYKKSLYFRYCKQIETHNKENSSGFFNKLKPSNLKRLKDQSELTSQNSTTFPTEYTTSHGIKVEIAMQLIHNGFYQDIQQVFDKFDLVNCYWAFDGTNIITTQTAIDACYENKLVDNEKIDLSVDRFMKYMVNYGFIPTPKTTIRALKDLKENGFRQSVY